MHHIQLALARLFMKALFLQRQHNTNLNTFRAELYRLWRRAVWQRVRGGKSQVVQNIIGSKTRRHEHDTLWGRRLRPQCRRRTLASSCTHLWSISSTSSKYCHQDQALVRKSNRGGGGRGMVVPISFFGGGWGGGVALSLGFDRGFPRFFQPLRWCLYLLICRSYEVWFRRWRELRAAPFVEEDML